MLLELNRIMGGFIYELALFALGSKLVIQDACIEIFVPIEWLELHGIEAHSLVNIDTNDMTLKHVL